MNQSNAGVFRNGECIAHRYQIVKPIGEGGMGKVYLAEDLHLNGQRWAVKWMPAAAEGEELRQAEHEAKMMTGISHPSLPRIVDYLVLEGNRGFCIVMDYVEGETLLQQSAFCGHRMEWILVVDYAVQLCDLLHYLHSLDVPVVFRDVKPSNVIVGTDRRIRLIDFGIARTYKEGKEADTVHVGSVGFAAPELLANRQTDHRADLYSLGCLIYFLVSGGQYYNFSKVPLGQAASKEIPEALHHIVKRLLQTDPDDRYPNAAEAKKEFEQLLAEVNQSKRLGEGGSVPKVPSSVYNRKIIAVYGLFSGSGATFVSTALAKSLAGQGVRTVYIESPWQPADPFLSLCGEANGLDEHWQEGNLTWRRQAGSASQSQFEGAELYKLLYETKGDAVVFDLSSGSNSAAAEAVLRASDIIIPVIAPFPAMLRQPATMENWERVTECCSPDQMYWIANRMPEGKRLSDFYRLFTRKPDCIIPELDYSAVIDAQWRAEWIADDPSVRMKLTSILKPLCKVIGTPTMPGGGWSRSAKLWLAKKWNLEYNRSQT